MTTHADLALSMHLKLHIEMALFPLEPAWSLARVSLSTSAISAAVVCVQLWPADSSHESCQSQSSSPQGVLVLQDK